MDIRDIKSLIKMVTETDITEFELESAEEKIRIKRGAPQEMVHYQVPPQVAMPQPFAPQISAAPGTGAPVTEAPPAAPVMEKGQQITSPIVGTMYRSPSPDAPPYVEVGQVVEKGQVLCIVEAMKLMNEIEAEYRCRIIKACKENAQPVEFGDTLFIVEQL